MAQSTLDPRERAEQMEQRITETMEALRQDIGRMEEKQARALFETSAEVLGGLATAFRHYRHQSEDAWRD